ncbi:MAG: DUF4430 domain-containing protein [Candidatus Doudnabacteria bacterium]|nr:DUF4430 domain-containing protein [Candidatus Doudnabacteria bacterium]
MTAKRLEIFIIVVIIAVIGVVYALTRTPVLAPTSENGAVTPNTNQNPGIAVGEPNPSMVISYSGVEGKNALELLRASHRVDVKSYSFGDMVTGIDGITPDTRHFWAMYVNGTMSQTGAGQFVTKKSDRIEWKIEEIKM